MSVVSLAKGTNVGITVLQVTLYTHKLQPIFKANWKGTNLFITESTHSRGVAILFRNSFNDKSLNSFSSNDGRIVLLNILIKDNIITLVCVCNKH